MPKEKVSVINKINFSEIISVLYIPFTVIYLELALMLKCKTDILNFFVPVLLFSFSFGMMLVVLSLIFKKDVIRKVSASAIIFLLCLYFTVEAFVSGSYHVFMTVDSIAQGTGGVLTDFSDAFFQAITGGFFAIAAMFLPFIIFIVLVFRKFDYSVSSDKKASLLGICAALVFVFSVSGAKTVRSDSTMLGIYQNAYNFDNAVRSFGLVTGTRLDCQYEIFGNPSDDDFVIEQPEIPVLPEEPSEDENETETE